MAELVAYPARFSFGRLFADAWRVFANAGGPIALGALAFGAVPISITEMPWWRGAPDTPAETFQLIWIWVTLAKVSLQLVAHAVTTTFVTAASLKALLRRSWREALAWPVLPVGFATSLFLNLLGNWPSLLSPFAVLFPSLAAWRWLFLAIPFVAFILIGAYFGVAVSAAICERLFIGPALVRSFRLLQGLRWRMVGIGLAYLVVVAVTEYGTVLALSLAGADYFGPGPGRAALAVAALVAGVLTHPISVSAYLQARSIADGPSAGELQDVFA